MRRPPDENSVPTYSKGNSPKPTESPTITPQPTTTWSPTNTPTRTFAPTVKPGMKRRRVRAATAQQSSERSGNTRRTNRKLQTGKESRNFKIDEQKEGDKLVGIDSLIALRKNLNSEKDVPKNDNGSGTAFEISALGNLAGFLFESEIREESPGDTNHRNFEGSEADDSQDSAEIDIPARNRTDTREWSFPISINAQPPNTTHLDNHTENEKNHGEKDYFSKDFFGNRTIPEMETELILDRDEEDEEGNGSTIVIGRGGLRSRRDQK